MIEQKNWAKVLGGLGQGLTWVRKARDMPMKMGAPRTQGKHSPIKSCAVDTFMTIQYRAKV